MSQIALIFVVKLDIMGKILTKNTLYTNSKMNSEMQAKTPTADF